MLKVERCEGHRNAAHAGSIECQKSKSHVLTRHLLLTWSWIQAMPHALSNNLLPTEQQFGIYLGMAH